MRLRIVGLSVSAAYAIAIELSDPSVYVTVRSMLPGKPASPSGRLEFQAEGGVVGLCRLPQGMVKSDGTAVQAVSVVIDGQLIHRVVEGEASVVDAVAVASDQRSEIPVDVDIVVDVVVAEHHVAHHTIFVRHHERHHAASVIGDAGFHARIVFKGV